MAASGFLDAPRRAAYDVVIVGGAMMGAAAAWFLADHPDFDGRVLVLERDPSYARSSTAHSHSCIRQQYSTGLNIRISQFAAAYMKDLQANLGGDARVPDLAIACFGYLYLAGSAAGAEVLRANLAVQHALGAGTRLMTPEEMHAAFPFYDLRDIVLGSFNARDEGFFDGAKMFEWWRRLSRDRGVDYVAGAAVAMSRNRAGDRIESVTLASGATVPCGHVVNASGPRAARTAAMAGIALPVEPRKRYSFAFRAGTPLDRPLPLTIDPSGVTVRQDGPGGYLAGCRPDPDPAADPDDFAMDPAIWEAHIWPSIAARIPAFERLRVVNEWVGHYAYNAFDQNAVIGPHPELGNFLFMNGFSGHGLQQAPAMGRGIAEWLVHGAYRTLDLSPFHFDRIAAGRPVRESAVI